MLVAQPVQFAFAAVGLRIADIVAVVAPLLGKHAGRALAGAGVLNGLAGRGVHREEIRALGHKHGKAESLGARFEVVAAHRVVNAGVLGVVIVLDDKHGRRLQHHRQIHGLEAGALVDRAIAREGHRYFAVVANLGGQRRTDRDGRAAGHNAVGAENALVDIRHMHGAALASAQPLGGAEQLLHHADHVGALGDTVAVATVGGNNGVGVIEMLAHADRVGFLARVQVCKAGDLAVHDLRVDAFLELADGFHHPVRLKQFLPGNSHACLSCWDGAALTPFSLCNAGETRASETR